MEKRDRPRGDDDANYVVQQGARLCFDFLSVHRGDLIDRYACLTYNKRISAPDSEKVGAKVDF